MGAAVGGQLCRDPKTRDPFGKGGVSVTRSISDWVGGRPTMVHNHKDMSEFADCWQGAHQVDVDVRKTARWHIHATDRKAHVPPHLGLLSIQASRSPEHDVFIHYRPQKSWRLGVKES